MPPTGLTILNIGFSIDFAVESVVLLSTEKMALDVSDGYKTYLALGLQPLNWDPSVLGRQLGPLKDAKTGTAGVYLTSKTSKGSYIQGRNYLLTAAHVMIPSTLLSGYGQHYAYETQNVQPVYITLPGRLDVVKKTL